MKSTTYIFSKRFYVAIAVPFLFCASICGIVVYAKLKTNNLDPADPTFYSFLPMAFFFMAMPIYALAKEVKRLRDTVETMTVTHREETQPPLSPAPDKGKVGL